MSKLEKQVEEFWEFLPFSFDIESREELEEIAKSWKPSNPMVVALHHIWKRDPVVTKLRTALEKIKNLPESRDDEACMIAIDALEDSE